MPTPVCEPLATPTLTAAAAAPPNPPVSGGLCDRGTREQRGGSGRAISARNATTHGLFARDIVLPTLGEDPAAFDALLQQLYQQLPPRNLLERHYLEQIAAASWRLRRLHRWQAQVYEDPTIDEDRRLDKLDKTLRHENALTRQIDRAVRLLGRDLPTLFETRARDEALYDYGATAQECKNEPELALDVQQRVWQQIYHADADPALDGAHLDNTEAASDAPTAQKCENELPPLSIAAIIAQNLRKRIPAAESTHGDSPPLSRSWERGPGGEGLCGPEGEGLCAGEEEIADEEELVDEWGLAPGEYRDAYENCENEPDPQADAPAARSDSGRED